VQSVKKLIFIEKSTKYSRTQLRFLFKKSYSQTIQAEGKTKKAAF